MESNKIHFIKFKKRNPEIENNLKHPFYLDLARSVDKGGQKLFAFTKEEDIFLKVVDYKLKKITDVFEKWGFEFDVLNVTGQVLSGEIQKKYPDIETEIFTEFRLNNTSIDDVLDKINDSGIESLDEVDKMILESLNTN